MNSLFHSRIPKSRFLTILFPGKRGQDDKKTERHKNGYRGTMNILYKFVFELFLSSLKEDRLYGRELGEQNNRIIVNLIQDWKHYGDHGLGV